MSLLNKLLTYDPAKRLSATAQFLDKHEAQVIAHAGFSARISGRHVPAEQAADV